MIDSMRIALLAILLLYVVPARAQESTPEQTVGAFKAASKSKLLELSKRFEIKDDWRGYVCQELTASMVQSSSPSVALVQVKSSDCQLSFILPFWHLGNTWKFRGTIELNNVEGSQPSVAVRQLVPGESPAIIVTDNPVASGTGLSQQNLQIFMLIDGGTKVVFNQPHHLFFRTQANSSEGGAYVQERESNFLFVTGHESAGRSTIIEEIRKSSVNGQSLVEHYSYGWDPRLKTLTLQASSPE